MIQQLRSAIASVFGGQPQMKRPPTVRLIRNVDDYEVNDMLADLEARGFWVINVLARTAIIPAPRGKQEWITKYDILVAGHEDPFWNTFGEA